MALNSLALASERPNIVFIFVDDLGYGDIEPFGSPDNRTPHLNRMAAEGRRFTEFYVSSTACTPSRAALLTGCYAARIGMAGPVLFPGGKRGLNPSETTIAELLKEQGYATGCFGKWHLGDQPEFLPLNHGFDEYEGIPYSNDMWEHKPNKDKPEENYGPLPYLKQDKVVARIPDGQSQALLCDAITDAAIDFIKRHKDGPFFAYVPHTFVHHPRFVKKELADRAQGDVTRAQIEAVDASTGRILDTLRELGIAENTLVFFTSDNGPARGCSAGPLRGAKGGPKYEGNMRVPALAWWPGRIPAGTVCSAIGTTVDILPTLARLTGAELQVGRIIDGKDMTSLLFDAVPKSRHYWLYYEFAGIREGRGKWKAVKVVDPAGGGYVYELYNLDNDLGERKDFADLKKGKTKELRKRLEAHEELVKMGSRPAGMVEHPTRLLEGAGDLPTLAEYRNQTNVVVVGVEQEK